ncbi:DNA-binding response regulator [Actinorhabdospora filicis]|uniref:DNA-binding response regulator n=1 Tax=Actinorhabdospora filicis TaxID=1785913 RepID=A0A9W6SFC8_9ACTN|nr:response regulator transcription factor [Actinorhabdospora filicis]GLZ75288.1 DNA-binding response regulator [Actinorhabdospora filicis]
MPADRPARVVLAEDGVLIREGVVGLLTRFGHEVVAAVGDVRGLRDAVSAYAPDLVVTDVRMPPTFGDEGLVAAIGLRAADPGLAVLVLSQYIEVTYAGELIDSEGAGFGYLLKDRVAAIGEFRDAVERVLAGGTVIDPLVVQRLVRRNRDPLGALSAREREVLGLMAEGRSNAAAARELSVSEAAVAKHVTGIFTKLGLTATEDDNRRVLAVLRYLRGNR